MAYSDDVSIADAAIEKYFGEPVRIEPRVAVRYGDPAADPDREARTVRGVFTKAPEVVPLGEGFRGGTRLSTEESRLWLSAAAITSLGWQPRAHDLAVFPQRSDARYEITVAGAPTDLGDMALTLSEER